MNLADRSKRGLLQSAQPPHRPLQEEDREKTRDGEGEKKTWPKRPK
ncbi:MAG: hypothetical protein JWP98_366 [Edaphobacter sp.]|nr:hypothetical protein [Edaphobacter sp.]